MRDKVIIRTLSKVHDWPSFEDKLSVGYILIYFKSLHRPNQLRSGEKVSVFKAQFRGKLPCRGLSVIIGSFASV